MKSFIFLFCEKYVEDDILRKMFDFGKSVMKNEVFRDIFGDERNKEKGFVDSISWDEFFVKGIVVIDKWDFIEKFNYFDKELVFLDYFRWIIEEDMKNGNLFFRCGFGGWVFL